MCLQAETNSHTISMPLNKLRTAENFLLICLRLWSQQNTFKPVLSSPDWRRGFNSVGLQEVDQQSFDQLLSTLFFASNPSPSIRYFACPEANEDELWFLECTALAQREDWTGLVVAFCRRLPDSCHQKLISLFQHLSQALTGVGLRLLFSDTTEASGQIQSYRLLARQQLEYSVISGKLH